MQTAQKTFLSLSILPVDKPQSICYNGSVIKGNPLDNKRKEEKTMYEKFDDFDAIIQSDEFAREYTDWENTLPSLQDNVADFWGEDY